MVDTVDICQKVLPFFYWIQLCWIVVQASVMFLRLCLGALLAMVSLVRQLSRYEKFTVTTLIKVYGHFMSRILYYDDSKMTENVCFSKCNSHM